MAEPTDPVQAPADREKAISAAYLRYLGATQEQAATSAGVGERTLARWETCSWWGEIKQAAADRWLSGLQAKARSGLELGVLTDGKLALSVLERLDDRFLPAKQRVEATGKDGGPIEHEHSVIDTRKKVAQRLDAIGGRLATASPSANGNGAHG